MIPKFKQKINFKEKMRNKFWCFQQFHCLKKCQKVYKLFCCLVNCVSPSHDQRESLHIWLHIIQFYDYNDIIIKNFFNGLKARKMVRKKELNSSMHTSSYSLFIFKCVLQCQQNCSELNQENMANKTVLKPEKISRYR